MWKRLVYLVAVLFLILPVSYTYSPDINQKHYTNDKDSYTYETYLSWFYNQLEDSVSKPDLIVFKKALTGFFKLKMEEKIEKNILTIIDFSLASNHKRLWVVDMSQMRISHSSYVAHGQNSGALYAGKFSNTPSSYQSSLGFYITGDIYYGRHGMSLFLDGQEKGINDKARERAIVMHSANYVSKDFIRQHGRLGRSHGCPAIPVEDHERIIQNLSGKSCLFIYHPEAVYHSKSTMLLTDRAFNGMIRFLEESPYFLTSYLGLPFLAHIQN